jgi:hypothetical protein
VRMSLTRCFLAKGGQICQDSLMSINADLWL